MVSVIVPIYNIEKYLEKCVSSIVRQTYKDLEIILVDDGSTDGSPALCEQIAKEDTRIRVIHKENGGLSDARNCGIANARGEWFVFIDGDDTVHPRMIERLFELAKTYQAEMAMCGFEAVMEDTPIEEENIGSPVIHVFDKLEYYNQFHLLETTLAWNKIYKRELFNGVQYPKGRLHEDECIIHRLADACRKMVFTEEKLYYYLTRNGSIMSKVTQQRVDDIVYAYRDRLNFCMEKGLNDCGVDTADSLINALVMSGYNSRKYEKSEKRLLLQKIKTYLADKDLVPEKLVSPKFAKQRELFLKNPVLCYNYRRDIDLMHRLKDKIKRMKKKQ